MSNVILGLWSALVPNVVSRKNVIHSFMYFASPKNKKKEKKEKDAWEVRQWFTKNEKEKVVDIGSGLCS